MKTVIYYSHFDKCFYMTSKQNYNSYIQSARDNHKLNGVKTPEDVQLFIEHACNWWNAKPEDFEVVL